MSTEYPLDPFTDFALRHQLRVPEDLELATEASWGPDMQPERREGAVAPSGNYEGMGDDNPYTS